MKRLVRLLIISFLPIMACSAAQAQTKLKLGPVGQQIHDDLSKATNAPAETDMSAQTARQKLGCDLLNLKPGCKTAKVTDDFKNIDSAMSEPLKAFVSFVQGDTKTAIELASSVDGLPDGNGQACFLQLQKSGNIITKLQETVQAGGSVGIATVYEVLRLLHMNLVQTCSNKSCTQIFNETTNVIVAAAPIKAQIPSFTQLCASIPPIAVEPVTTVAATMPAPVATPAPMPSPVPTSTSSPTPAPQ